MRILFLCRFLPHVAARDSGRLDTYHYISALSRDHAVDLIAFVMPEEAQWVPSMEEVCEKVVAVPFRERDLGARLYRAWRRLIQPKIYGRNHSPAYVRALRRLLAESKYDVAVVDGVMAEYGRFLDGVPAVLDEVDVYFVMAHRLFRDEPRRLYRAWLGFDWLRTAQRETAHVRRFAGVVVRSAKDEQILREFAPQQEIVVIPAWFEGLVELMALPAERPPLPNLLFVGAMQIPANVTAATFFARRVLPLLREERPEIRFTIVGSKPAAAVRDLATLPGVTVTGEVPELAPYFADAAVVVVPLFTGGGIIVKTLNGLASGRPVIATVLGNSGTGARPGRDLLIVPPEPRAMADAVLRVLNDEALWRRLSENGRDYIRHHFDWPGIVKRLDRFLRRASAGE